MYENGTMLNRYAAKDIHRKKRQRQFTPKYYSSYRDYKEDQERKHGSWFWTEIQRSHGHRPDWERWWHAYSGWTHPGWKKILKKENNSSARVYYRDLLATYDPEEDIIIIEPNRFKDPWAYD